MSKTVYFATGTPEQTLADLCDLLSAPQASLRVVVSSDAMGRELAAQLQRDASLSSESILLCGLLHAPLVFLRLWLFLGYSRDSHLICWKAPGRSRILKLIAVVLPGKLTFSEGPDAHISCSRAELVRAAWRKVTSAQGPICVIGSASHDDLVRIVQRVRNRYRNAPLHGLYAAPSEPARYRDGLFDSQEVLPSSLLIAYLRLLPRCLGTRRFRRVIIAWTNDRSVHKTRGLKWLAWLLPRWPVEIYNENLDAFNARDPLSLIRHWMWRSSQAAKFRRMQRELLLAERKRRHRALPVAVVGSASGYYLEKIVPVVRAAFPEAKIHGVIPSSLEAPAAGLFDSTTVLESGFARSLAQCLRLWRQKFQCCVVPCTDEHYAGMRLLAAFLPLGPRHIYNELADGFPLRKLRIFYQHLAWRMRDHLSFQIFTGAAGGNLLFKAIHFAAYSVRLLAGAVVLAKVRMASRLRALLVGSALQSKNGAASRPTDSKIISVDLILLQRGEEADSLPLPDRPGLRLRVAARLRLNRTLKARTEDINLQIRQSLADYICILDSRCRMSSDDWIERLIESFDDRTGQVGPQISFADGGVVRGGLLLPDRQPRWNSNNSVCWHRRPEWLDTDTLPWICILLRRSVFDEIGYFDGICDDDPLRVDLDFCARLCAHGWKSICNQNVTASLAEVVSADVRESVGAALHSGASTEELK